MGFAVGFFAPFTVGALVGRFTGLEEGALVTTAVGGEVVAEIEVQPDTPLPRKTFTPNLGGGLAQETEVSPTKL